MLRLPRVTTRNRQVLASMKRLLDVSTRRDNIRRQIRMNSSTTIRDVTRAMVLYVRGNNRDVRTIRRNRYTNVRKANLTIIRRRSRKRILIRSLRKTIRRLTTIRKTKISPLRLRRRTSKNKMDSLRKDTTKRSMSSKDILMLLDRLLNELTNEINDILNDLRRINRTLSRLIMLIRTFRLLRGLRDRYRGMTRLFRLNNMIYLGTISSNMIDFLNRNEANDINGTSGNYANNLYRTINLSNLENTTAREDNSSRNNITRPVKNVMIRLINNMIYRARLLTTIYRRMLYKMRLYLKDTTTGGNRILRIILYRSIYRSKLSIYRVGIVRGTVLRVVFLFILVGRGLRTCKCLYGPRAQLRRRAGNISNGATRSTSSRRPTNLSLFTSRNMRRRRSTGVRGVQRGTIRRVLRRRANTYRNSKNNRARRTYRRNAGSRRARSTTSMRRLIRRTTIRLNRMLTTRNVTRLANGPYSRRNKSSKRSRNRGKTRGIALLYRESTRAGDSRASDTLRRKIARAKRKTRRQDLSNISDLQIRIFAINNMLLLRKDDRARHGNANLQNTIMRHRLTLMNFLFIHRLLKIILIKMRLIRHKDSTMRGTRIRLAFMIPKNLGIRKTPRRLRMFLRITTLYDLNYITRFDFLLSGVIIVFRQIMIQINDDYANDNYNEYTLTVLRANRSRDRGYNGSHRDNSVRARVTRGRRTRRRMSNRVTIRRNKRRRNGAMDNGRLATRIRTVNRPYKSRDRSLLRRVHTRMSKRRSKSRMRRTMRRYTPSSIRTPYLTRLTFYGNIINGINRIKRSNTRRRTRRLTRGDSKSNRYRYDLNEDVNRSNRDYTSSNDRIRVQKYYYTSIRGTGTRRLSKYTGNRTNLRVARGHASSNTNSRQALRIRTTRGTQIRGTRRTGRARGRYNGGRKSVPPSCLLAVEYSQ